MILPIFLWNKQGWRILDNIKETKNSNKNSINLLLIEILETYIKAFTTPNISALESYIHIFWRSDLYQAMLWEGSCSFRNSPETDMTWDWGQVVLWRLAPSSVVFIRCSSVFNDDIQWMSYAGIWYGIKHSSFLDGKMPFNHLR